MEVWRWGLISQIENTSLERVASQRFSVFTPPGEAARWDDLHGSKAAQ